MTKNIFLTAVFCCFLNFIFGQTDPSFQPPNSKSKIPSVEAVFIAPKVDNLVEHNLAKVAVEETEDKMLRFGKELDVNVDFFSMAEQFVQPNGRTIYQLGISAKTAKSINLILNDFQLAIDARLFLTDRYAEEYIGAYTAANNNEARVLGTELIKSDFVYLVLDEPAFSSAPSTFTLATIVHGFVDLETLAKGLNTSGNCHYDVNCAIGTGYELQRNSVAMIIIGGSLCTGSLVHNTSGTVKPYLLSARHCGTNPTNWVFRFRWEAPLGGTSCATTSPSADGPQNMTLNGAVLKAQNSSSDFVLVHLNTPPNPAWGIYYNGWDNTDMSNVSKGISIHHPDGDIKKISIEENALAQQTITFLGLPNHTWMISDWDYGVTEPGSSGSPLFNQDKRLIGVLSGGTASCSGTSDNGQPDYYGRFGYAWDNSASISGRLKDWLDSTGTGATIIDGIDPAIGTETVDASISSVSGFPNSKCDSIAYPNFILLNSGTDTLNEVVFSYGFVGSSPQNYTWTGSLPTYGQATVSLPFIQIPVGNSDFEVHVLSANSSVDLNPLNDEISLALYRLQDDFTARLSLDLDCYGSETTWFLKDSMGNKIYEGGPYMDSTPGLIEMDLCLSYACYQMVIRDEYGDGLSGCDASDGGNGSYTLTNLNDGMILAEITEANANFGSENTQNFCTSVNSLSEVQLENLITIFPNPGKENLKIHANNLNLQEIQLWTVTGQKVFQQTVNGNQVNIHTNQLPKAFYLVKITTDKGELIQRWIKQ